MKLIKIIVGIIFFVGPLFWIPNFIDQYRIERFGEIVEMEITKMPSPCSYRGFVHFKYRERSFSHGVGKLCGSSFTGDIVKMKYLDGVDKTLYPDERVWHQLLSILIISGFGLFLIFKKIPSNTSLTKRPPTVSKSSNKKNK